MKVYNIKDSREFFEKLTACKGTVEIVKEDGTRLPPMAGSPTSELQSMTCFQGAIRQMELYFQDQNDCTQILHYLINKRNLAA